MVDVSHLEIGQTMHLGDIKPPEGVEIVGDKGISVISVAEPITEAEEQAALEAGQSVADVEMIKEKKEDGTEAAPAKAGDKAPAAKGDAKAAPAGDKKAAPAEKKK